MPSIDDEDETLCLLAADQEESPGPRQPVPCGGGAASYNQVSPWVDSFFVRRIISFSLPSSDSSFVRSLGICLIMIFK